MNRNKRIKKGKSPVPFFFPIFVELLSRMIIALYNFITVTLQIQRKHAGAQMRISADWIFHLHRGYNNVNLSIEIQSFLRVRQLLAARTRVDRTEMFPTVSQNKTRTVKARQNGTRQEQIGLSASGE